MALAQATIDALREIKEELKGPAIIAELVVETADGNTKYIANPLPAVIFDEVQKHRKGKIAIHSSFDSFSVDATFSKEDVTPHYHKPENSQTEWFDKVEIRLLSDNIAFTSKDGSLLLDPKAGQVITLTVDGHLHAAQGYADVVDRKIG